MIQKEILKNPEGLARYVDLYAKEHAKAWCRTSQEATYFEEFVRDGPRKLGAKEFILDMISTFRHMSEKIILCYLAEHDVKRGGGARVACKNSPRDREVGRILRVDLDKGLTVIFADGLSELFPFKDIELVAPPCLQMPSDTRGEKDASTTSTTNAGAVAPARKRRTRDEDDPPRGLTDNRDVGLAKAYRAGSERGAAETKARAMKVLKTVSAEVMRILDDAHVSPVERKAKIGTCLKTLSETLAM